MNYYQRYYLFFPFEEPKDQNPEGSLTVEFEKDPFMVAYTALFLASKNEDCIKKLKDIQTVANKLRDLDPESRNTTRSSASPAPTLAEVQRKVIMSLEFKLLQVLKYDFLNGAAAIPSVDQLVVMFSKKLGLNYKMTMFAWLVSFDIMSTPLSLVIPSHCIAMAIVIVTLNVKPDEMNLKFNEEDATVDTAAILEHLDLMGDFRCPETLVNEGIIYLLDYYIHQMNFSILNEFVPAIDSTTKKEQVFKFMDLKLRFNDLQVLSEQSVSTNALLKQDNYLRTWDPQVAAKGAARFMITNKRRRFDEELNKKRPAGGNQ